MPPSIFLGSVMARRRKQRADHAAGYEHNEMIVIARKVRKFIKYLGAVLVALFAYLQLKDFQVVTAIESLSPDLVRRLTMITYYWCWIFGATFDTNIQELAYYTEKERNKLTWHSFALMVLFGIVMGALLWAAHDDRLFATVLTVFFLFNIGGFIYILRFIAPIVITSEIRYRENKSYFSLAQLEIVSQFMHGSWQRYRFALGIMLVLLMNAICFSETLRTMLAQTLSDLIAVDGAMLTERLPTFTFLIFVAVLESWIWVQRARLAVAVDLLEYLSGKYRLEPRPAVGN